MGKIIPSMRIVNIIEGVIDPYKYNVIAGQSHAARVIY